MRTQRNPAIAQVTANRALAHETVRAYCGRRKILACMLSPEDALAHLQEMLERRLPHSLPMNEDEGRGVHWLRTSNLYQRALFKQEWQMWSINAQAEEAQRLTREGVERFGTDWLLINECLQEAAYRYGVDGRQQHESRAFFMGLAFRCLETFAEKEPTQS